jgi:hypothetical protein
MPTNYRKRRVRHGPSKNELRAARNERAKLAETRADTLGQRFPEVGRLELNLRLESPSGTILDRISRTVGPDEPLQLDVPCPSTCGGGSFSLLEAVENGVTSSDGPHEGMSICQNASYADPRSPCGTKLYYQITIHRNKGD